MGVLLWPNGVQPSSKCYTSTRTLEDIQLQQICNSFSFNSYYKLSVDELSLLWTDDPAVIAYRQCILEDLNRNAALQELFANLLDNIETWESHSNRGRHGNESEQRVLDMWSFSFLESYTQKLSEIHQAMDQMLLESAGLSAFRDKIRLLYEESTFTDVKNVFQKDFSGYTMPSRISVGVNLNRTLKPVSIKLLGIPEKAARGKRMSMTPSAVSTARMVAAKTVAEAGGAVSRFVSMHSRELRAIKQDIIFYLSAIKLKDSWTARGMRYCLPEIAEREEKAFVAQDMFNPLLVINQAEKIITNDIEFKPSGEILVLTGANQGGKTIFLQSVALVQWLTQLGIYAPCSFARISPATQVLTVFAPTVSGSTAIRSKGLLTEEAERISDTIKRMTPDCMVFFNEPLNATSPAENLSISRDVLAVLKASGARGIWVTHLYELASEREEMNTRIDWGSAIGSIRIVVRAESDCVVSTYRVERGEPEFNSYAAEVLQRGGIHFDE